MLQGAHAPPVWQLTCRGSPSPPGEEDRLQGVLTRLGSGALALVVIAALAACGSSDKDKTSGSSASKSGSSASTQNTLTISIAEQGKTAKFTLPKTAKGGLTTVKLTNNGKMPHEAQLLLVKGNHTAQDVAKVFSDQNSTDKAEWLRTRGGVGVVTAGQTGTGTVMLEPGHYIVADASQNGPPATADLTVTAGENGSLPSTDTKVTAAEAGHDKWRWDISGPLKAGTQDVTFKSEGKEAIHFLGAIQLKPNVDEKQVLKALGTKEAEKFVDPTSFYSTAILDGGKSQVTQFRLSKPGRWLLFCPLTDRGEKKEHDKQGLAKIVTVK